MLLYKYRKIDDNTLNSIRDNYLYFSYPSTFNDPFDSKVDFFINATNEELLQWWGEKGMPEEQRTLLSKKIKENSFKKTMRKQMVPDNILICCLSEINNNILMWSHYADSHKGICLAFRPHSVEKSMGILFDEPNLDFQLANAPKGYLPALSVKYQQEMPLPYDAIISDTEQIMKFLKTKYSDWAYERERRIMVPKRNTTPQIIRFKKDALVGIIFGMLTPETDISRIKGIMQEQYINQGYQIIFWRSKAILGQYAVKIELMT